MDSSAHDKRDLVIAWTKQCFQATGLEASEREIRSYAATAASEISDDGLVGVAEGRSVAQKKIAGGTSIPDFLTYLKRSAPQDAEGRLDAFDEIFQRFVDLTASVEAAGETGVLANAAYNRSLDAADAILRKYFEVRRQDLVQNLHEGFGDANTPAIDMSKVTAGKALGGGCVIAAIAIATATVGAAPILLAILALTAASLNADCAPQRHGATLRESVQQR
jgi:hypothetical protein